MATRNPRFLATKNPHPSLKYPREGPPSDHGAVQPTAAPTERHLYEISAVTNGHNATFQELGSYRAAAAICGTTDKTVKRAVAKVRAAETGPLGLP